HLKLNKSELVMPVQRRARKGPRQNKSPNCNCSVQGGTFAPLRLCEKPGNLMQVSRKGAKAQSSQRFSRKFGLALRTRKIGQLILTQLLSKRPSDMSAACLRARYCTGIQMSRDSV